MSFARLKVRATSPSPGDWRVWLNDEELTSSLSGLTIQIEAADASQVELRMFVGDLDVDADTLAVLEAYVNARAEA